MPRSDYDRIKNNFASFVSVFESKKTDLLNAIIKKNAMINLEPYGKNADGSCHTLEQYKEFIRNYPETGILNMRIYNYVCRLKDDQAQQTAYVVCLAMNKRNDEQSLDYFFYTKMFANHWVKEDNEWILDSIKMDVYPQMGNLRKVFEEKWLFEDVKAILKPGVHYPCIMPEFDSPWLVIPDSEDVLTEEEKVVDGLMRYDFGIDNLSFTHCLDGISDSYACSGTRNHKEGKRGWLTGVKFNRQKARHWVHPYLFREVRIEEDRAFVLCDRMAYQKQLKHEYEWTMDNYDTEVSCARCYIEMVKENDMWKMCYFGYDIGLYEVGKYDGRLFADKI